MKRILICSIIRDTEKFLPQWYENIAKLQALCGKEYIIDISTFENDSKDNSNEYIESLKSEHKIFDWYHTSKAYNALKHGSVWDIERMFGLALYRNHCLEQVDLNKYDKVAFIETDISYDPYWCQELILARHPSQAKINPHIYSAWSLRSESNPKESMFLYDTCASRQYSSDIMWNFKNEDKWRNESLIRTDLGQPDDNCLHKAYSTFNCFCVYDATPIKNGARFAAYNSRINASNVPLNKQQYLECDTVTMCEKFHDLGLHNVLINLNCIVRHL